MRAIVWYIYHHFPSKIPPNVGNILVRELAHTPKFSTFLSKKLRKMFGTWIAMSNAMGKSPGTKMCVDY